MLPRRPPPRGLQLPDCLAPPAPPRAFCLAAPRCPVGTVVPTRDSQRRVRPGRAVAAGPGPGATLRRRRRIGSGRGPCPAGSGRLAASPLSAAGRRGRAASGRSCKSVGRGERAGGPFPQAARTEEAPPGCRGESSQPGQGRGLDPRRSPSLVGSASQRQGCRPRSEGQPAASLAPPGH